MGARNDHGQAVRLQANQPAIAQAVTDRNSVVILLRHGVDLLLQGGPKLCARLLVQRNLDVVDLQLRFGAAREDFEFALEDTAGDQKYTLAIHTRALIPLLGDDFELPTVRFPSFLNCLLRGHARKYTNRVQDNQRSVCTP